VATQAAEINGKGGSRRDGSGGLRGDAPALAKEDEIAQVLL